jgi:S-DNA-T family DNA segregation ATPase FtsK/SpoIIIE
VVKKEIIREILVIFIVLVTLFAFLSLITFHSADWPSAAQAPMNLTISNLCGVVGSAFAYAMFAHIGVLASYGVVILAGCWAVMIFMKKKFETPWVKVLGGLMLLIALATIERLLIPENFFYGRLTGGFTGTYLAEGLLLARFNFTGAMLIALAFFLVALPLATDLLFYDVIKSGVARYRNWRERRAEACEEAENAAKEAASTATPAGESSPYVGPDESVFGGSKKSKRKKKAKIEKEEEESEPVEGITEEKPKPEKKPPKLKKLRVSRRSGKFVQPSVELLQAPVARDADADAEFIRKCREIIEGTLANFRIRAEVKDYLKGPVITQFEIKLAPGISGRQVRQREDDLAIALGVPSVRVDFPLPGRTTIGVQVPNPERDMVVMRDVMNFRDPKIKKMILPVFLGKDIYGNKIIADLASLPHLLIAGTTNSGKSICLNSIMLSLLMHLSPDEVKFIIVDPKKVELTAYENLPHLLHPIVDDCGKAFTVLEWAIEKVMERYGQLKRVGAKNIQQFNELGKEKIYGKLEENEKHGFPYFMPYIVIVVDELAEMVMYDREAETPLIRVAQLARAVGIHLVLATQKPHSNVISTMLKSNMPARIAFNVTSSVPGLRGRDRVPARYVQ